GTLTRSARSMPAAVKKKRAAGVAVRRLVLAPRRVDWPAQPSLDLAQNYFSRISWIVSIVLLPPLLVYWISVAVAEPPGRLLNLEIHRRCFPAVLFDLILEVLPFIERAQPSALDRGYTVPRGISMSQVPIRPAPTTMAVMRCMAGSGSRKAWNASRDEPRSRSHQKEQAAARKEPAPGRWFWRWPTSDWLRPSDRTCRLRRTSRCTNWSRAQSD